MVQTQAGSYNCKYKENIVWTETRETKGTIKELRSEWDSSKLTIVLVYW